MKHINGETLTRCDQKNKLITKSNCGYIAVPLKMRMTLEVFFFLNQLVKLHYTVTFQIHVTMCCRK